MSNIMDISICVANENVCLENVFTNEFDFINEMIFHMFWMDLFSLEMLWT